MTKKYLKYLLIVVNITIIVDVINILFFDNNALVYIALSIYAIEFISQAIILKKDYIFTRKAFFDLFFIITSLFIYIRILKVFRFLKFFKYLRIVKIIELNDSKIAMKISKTFNDSKRELSIILITTVILITISSVLIYRFEHDAQPEVFANLWDGIWWTFTTISTVGYGDKYPITNAGKIVAIFDAFLGIGIVTLPSAIFIAGFISPSMEEMFESHEEVKPTKEVLLELNELLDEALIDLDEYNRLREEALGKIHKKKQIN